MDELLIKQIKDEYRKLYIMRSKNLIDIQQSEYQAKARMLEDELNHQIKNNWFVSSHSTEDEIEVIEALIKQSKLLIKIKLSKLEKIHKAELALLKHQFGYS